MRSQTVGTSVVLVLLVLGIAGLAGVDSAESPEQAAQVPEKIPASAREIKNPVPATPDSVADGKLIYSSQCTMCHGSAGDGKGDLAARFHYTMPDFTTAETQRAGTDGEWFYVLTHGHGKMSGEGDRLSEKVRWNLVNYLRSLGPQAGS